MAELILERCAGSYTFRAVWPVVDRTRTVQDLMAEAEDPANPDSVWAVAARHAVSLRGDRNYRVRWGAQVPGSGTEGRVLVCECLGIPDRLRTGIPA